MVFRTEKCIDNYIAAHRWYKHRAMATSERIIHVSTALHNEESDTSEQDVNTALRFTEMDTSGLQM